MRAEAQEAILTPGACTELGSISGGGGPRMSLSGWYLGNRLESVVRELASKSDPLPVGQELALSTPLLWLQPF